MKKPINTEGMGERLRALREGLNMTREEFAEEIGITAGYVAEVELSKKTMSSITIGKTCEALSVSADYLMFGRKEKANVDLIIEMLSNMDQKYVDYAADILKAYVLAIGSTKS